MSSHCDGVRFSTTNDDLAELLEAIPRSVPVPSTSQERALRQIEVLTRRLAAERFQVAVLGQFKRGKSTLLNALLGMKLLPTSVVPLTAIPTFLQAGPVPFLRVMHGTGKSREIPVHGVDELREQLQALVTESGNPKNALNISRVEVTAPAALLDQGVVLIDTPGVGSTFHHNTATADALLPECDACIFVVSPDPPITEVEIAYLSRIRQTVARIIVVLNKIDVIEEHDQPAAVEFLRQVLEDQAGFDGSPIFLVSARDAVRAKDSGDGQALDRSGLAALETYLGHFLTRDRSQVLRRAVARKAAALTGELAFEMEVVLQSFRLPVQDLEERLAVFGEAEQRFDISRRAAQDLLTGDRARTTRRLETISDQLRTDALVAMREELDRISPGAGGVDQDRAALTARAGAFFGASLGRLTEEMRSSVVETLSAHQERADKLIGLVRRTAAEILDIPFRAPEAGDAFAEYHEPYWAATGRTETVIPFRSGSLDWLLPGPVRQKRLARRLMAEAEVLVTRNVENLRWAMLRNLDDAFRRFGAALDERLAMALQATKGAMQTALERRKKVAAQIEPEIANRQQALRRFNEIQAALTRMADPGAQAPDGLDDPQSRHGIRAMPGLTNLPDR